MEIAVLFVACNLAVGIAEEGKRLTRDGGEPIDTRGAEPVLGFVENGEEPVALYDFKRVAWFVGVGANIV
jgi:hypothetical protein